MTGTGFTDSKASHYTQFCGVILRASAETFKNASGLREEDDISVGGDFRGLTPVRGFTPGPSGDISRRNSKKDRRFNGNASNGNMEKAMSPQRQMDKAMSPRPSEKALSPRPEVPVIQEAPEERLIKEENGQIEKTQAEETDSKEQQPPQSYLALTKLGGPEKKPAPSPAQTAPAQGSRKQVKRNIQSQDTTTTATGGLFSFVKGR